MFSAYLKGEFFVCNVGHFKLIPNEEFKKITKYHGNVCRRYSVFSFKEHNNVLFGEFIDPNPELRYNKIIKVATTTGISTFLKEV